MMPAGIGKVAISLAPPTAIPNPAGVQVVYATIEGTGGNFPITGSPYTNILGIFATTDQGVTWTFQGTGPNLAGGVCQCFYTNTIAVDPASPGDGVNDIIYWGGTNTWKSTNSGVAFADITNGIHADSHSWASLRALPQSYTPATTAVSGGPKTGVQPGPGPEPDPQRLTRVDCRPGCSITWTSSATRLPALRSARSRTTETTNLPARLHGSILWAATV